MEIYKQKDTATAVLDKVVAPIGYVHSIETFGSVDGPGIRYVLFLQGCRMRCQFCHNPDTWNTGVGDEVTADQVLADAEKYKAFWGQQGGITTSGGEALLQIDFLIDLFKKAKAKGIRTCLDTCGQPFTRQRPWFDKFEELMRYTDISLVDIKQINVREHKRLTGWRNENIFDMLQYMLTHHKHVWIRHVLVPQRTDYDYQLIQIGNYIKTIAPIVDKVEVLPYHTMGVNKYTELGIKYPLAGIEPPSLARVKNAEKLLHTADYQRYRDYPNYQA